jgi:hypothetical protein
MKIKENILHIEYESSEVLVDPEGLSQFKYSRVYYGVMVVTIVTGIIIFRFAFN